MILLDTHIWVWWVHGDPRLPQPFRNALDTGTEPLGVSVMSCWEVAKLAQLGKIMLPEPTDSWIGKALRYPRAQLLPFSVEIAIEANALPGTFHRDPIDQILVATARLHACPIMTLDHQILAYPHVRSYS